MTKFFSKAFEFFLTTSLYFGMGLLLLIAWQYILSISIFFGYVDATKIHTTWYEFFLLVTVFTFIMVLLTWWLDIRFSFRGKYIEPPKPCTSEPQAKFQYEGYAPGVVPEKLQHKSGGNVIVECGSGKCQVCSEKAIIDKISENVRSDFILSVRSRRDDSRIDKPFITLLKLKDGTEIQECGDNELDSTVCAMKTFNEYFDKAVKPTFDLHHPL